MIEEGLKRELERASGSGSVMYDEPMSAHTTFRVGGLADAFVMPGGVDELRAVLALCADNGVKPYIMGRGSNLLVSDAGLRGVVIQIAGNMAALDVSPNGIVKAQAGVTNAKVAATACREGLAGYEFAAGIPGTVGGAAIMNAGAYDGEFKQVATGVTCITRDMELVDVPRSQADWSYRHSMMGDTGMIVVEAQRGGLSGLVLVAYLEADDVAADGDALCVYLIEFSFRIFLLQVRDSLVHGVERRGHGS